MRFTAFLAVVFLSAVSCERLIDCETTKGRISILVRPEWSPLGAARFLELVNDKFFDDMLLYRALEGFLVQFGVAANPTKHKQWEGKTLTDEKSTFPVGSWKKGFLSFAGAGANSRDCHMFITLAEPGQSINPYLGGEKHEVPFAEIISGIENIENLEFSYDDAPIEHQGRFAQQGNQYMLGLFPKLDRILTCRVAQVPPLSQPPKPPLSQPPMGQPPMGEPPMAPPRMGPPPPGSLPPGSVNEPPPYHHSDDTVAPPGARTEL